jgi:hypothetical protein
MSRNEWLAVTFLALPTLGALILAGATYSWWILAAGIAVIGCGVLGFYFLGKGE